MKVSILIFIVSLAHQLSFAQYHSNMDKWITDLAYVIQYPEKVYHLDLSNQDLEEVPDVVSRCNNLISINLSGNKIQSLDDKFADLEFLKIIELNENYLKSLDLSEFNTCIEKIEGIWARGNLIEQINGDLSLLSNCKVINLGNNRLSQFKLSSDLNSLIDLQLDANQLSRIPTRLKDCSKLKYLNLNENQIFEAKFSMFPDKLFELNLGDNPIRNLVIDEGLFKLERLILDWIDLSQVSLKLLPSSIRTLSMEHCQLKSIESILHLRKLEELSLIENRIENMDQLFDLSKLRKLWIEGNPIASISSQSRRLKVYSK